MVQRATFLDYMFPPENLEVFSERDRGDIRDAQAVAQITGTLVGVLFLTMGVASLFFGAMGAAGIVACSLIGVVAFVGGGVMGHIGAVVFPIIMGFGCCCVSMP
jgi:hypothetical protein